MPLQALPLLGAIAQFVVANGGRAGIRKYGAKAVEKARKQIKARQKTIDKRVADKKAADKMFGKKKGETYPSKFTAKERARGAEVQRTKALKRRLEAEKPKARFDEEGFPLDEVPLKFSKGGRARKASGGSVSSRLTQSGPVAKPN